MVDLARDADSMPLQSQRRLRHRTMAGPAHDAEAAALAATTDRVASVDALRGLAIFFIIAGDALAWALYSLAAGMQAPAGAIAGFFSQQLMHADWEGFRFYDFLFPLFIFVTGISIVLSLPRIVERDGKWAAHKRVLRRSFLLFALGFIYYGGVSTLWPEIRLLGVLQRIALCYLFASLLFLNLDLRGLLVAFVALLVGYWALMTFVPVPDIGAGSFAENANVANWIDAQYLPGQLFYGEWDPEGLLSTLPAIASCLLGVLAGFLLKETSLEPAQKVLWFAVAGAILIVVGLLWGLQFPLIKKIWTSSFVLVAGGCCALLLGALYLLVDIWGRKAWATVFLWFGANAIALYMINNIGDFKTFARRLVGGDISNFLDAYVMSGMGALAIVAVAIALAVAVAGFLYQRKIFLRV
jgi:predicted acyltransferase